MKDSCPLLARRMILEDEPSDLELIEDEILLDLEGGPGTAVLAATCYGQAVRECLTIDRDHYLLKVHPDLRALLLRQLAGSFRAFPLHRVAGAVETRMIVTKELQVWFHRASSGRERRSALSGYVPDERRPEGPESGIYPLIETLTDSPIAVSLALQIDPVVEQAAPVVVPLPPEAEWGGRRDLMVECEGGSGEGGCGPGEA